MRHWEEYARHHMIDKYQQQKSTFIRNAIADIWLPPLPSFPWDSQTGAKQAQRIPFFGPSDATPWYVTGNPPFDAKGFSTCCEWRSSN
jgi:hypothetical protein